MSEPDPAVEADRRHIADAWRAIAAEDARVASGCIAMSPPALAMAAYLCQQSAEKSIKGLLVLASVAFGKTHDLGVLADLAGPHYPDLCDLLRDVRPMTLWGVAFRYPPSADEVPETLPSAHELSSALDTLKILIAGLHARAAGSSDA
jgi:HEPN domain-containing protein